MTSSTFGSRPRMSLRRCVTRLSFALVLALLPLLGIPSDAAAKTAHTTRAVGPLVPASARPATAVSPIVATQATTATTTFSNTVALHTLSSIELAGSTYTAVQRTEYTTTLLEDGHILIAGGFAPDGVAIDTAELYDPTNGIFTTTGSLRDARAQHTATRLEDGTVLLVGGRSADGGFLGSAELYNPTTGTFTIIGSITPARDRHSSTLLPDGKVLIAGGFDVNFRAVANADLYDPATGTFSRITSLLHQRGNFTATLLDSGDVLIAGGLSPETGFVEEAELYQSTTSTFTTTGKLAHPRQGHTATKLLDGRVLLAGGMGDSAAELYDPTSGRFTLIIPMLHGRYSHDATLLPDSRVLVAGGTSDIYSEVYDPTDNSWTATDGNEQPAYFLRLTALPDGKAVALVGFFKTSSTSYPTHAEQYDVATEIWTQFPSTTFVSRSRHTSTLLGDGSVLITGGYDANHRTLAQSSRYDALTRDFVATGSLIQARYNHTATVLPDGKVLIAGGTDDDEHALASAEVYDPATGTFTTTGNLLHARFNHTATTLADGHVLIVGGSNDGAIASAELYDPASGTFTATGSLNESHRKHSATRLGDGRVLIAGGESGFYPPSNELYDPATGTFTRTTTMIRSRLGHTATLIPDGTVLVAGGSGVPEHYITYDISERYDPATGNWKRDGTMMAARFKPATAVLSDTTVMLIGGYAQFSEDNPYNTHRSRLTSVEQYVPSTHSFATAGSLKHPRGDHTATVLQDDTILIFGDANVATAELATVTTNTLTGSLTLPDGWLTTTSPVTFSGTTSGAALVSGSINEGPTVPLTSGDVVTTTVTPTDDGINRPVTLRLADAEGRSAIVVVGTVDYDTTAPTSRMTSLTSPSIPAITLKWSGSDATSGIKSYDVQVRDGEDGTWTPLLRDTTALSTTFTGVRTHTYFFRVRAHDIAGNVEAWSATYDATTTVDPLAPQSSMTRLPATSPATITLRWSGSDTISGVAGYDLEVRDSTIGTWTPVLTNTDALSTTFTGTQGHDYFFRVRARDGADNVEDWPADYDATTEIDTIAPAGAFSINRGALATTGINVTLSIDAQDTQSTVTHMRVGLDGTFGAWQSYEELLPYALAKPDGAKEVSLQFRDSVGNTSTVYTQTIVLDTDAGSSATLAIDDDALYTNTPTVTLRIGAPRTTWQMQISNNGSFRDAEWQLFDTNAPWTIETFNAYTVPRLVYVRTRDIDGAIQPTAIDDIIFDPIAPTGSITITNVATTAVTVRLQAADNLSQVAEMRVSSNPQFADATWRPYATAATIQRSGTGTPQAYVQFRDRAGNPSAVISTTPDPLSGVQVFLPLVRR